MTSISAQHLRSSGVELQHSQPRRLKRGFGILPEDSDLPTSKRVYHRIAHWLDTLHSPTRAHSSDSYRRPAISSRTRSCSAPAMSSFIGTLHPAPSTSCSFLQPLQSDYDCQLCAEPTESSKTTTSGATKVGDAFYRDDNLRMNYVHLRTHDKALPPELHIIMNQIYAACTPPPPQLPGCDPALAQLEYGAGEVAVERYFNANVFPEIDGPSHRSDKCMMYKHAIPGNPETPLRLSQPVPDIVYGYRYDAFTEPQQMQLGGMGPEVKANSDNLYYPFLVIEMKADGPHEEEGGGGGLYVATNQCLGGSASCVKLAIDVYTHLRSCGDVKVHVHSNAAFSIAMNGTEARLFITWKDDGCHYYMQKINHYMLQRPEELWHFRQHVRNILDWGGNARLDGIRETLDTLLEERRIERSKYAKACAKPSVDERSLKKPRLDGKA